MVHAIDRLTRRPLAQPYDINLPSHRPRVGHPRHTFGKVCNMTSSDVVAFVHVIQLDNSFYEVENVLRRNVSTGEFSFETWINGEPAHNVNAVRTLEDLRNTITLRGKIF
jgi:hypothetical protein